MNVQTKPSIVTCDTKSTTNRGVYDAWATNYEKDIRDWGYDLPEKVACALRKYMTRGKIRVVDCGAGDGLSGLALRREAATNGAVAYIAGNDISPRMLDIAKDRGCYDEIMLVDMNEKPLPYDDNSFDFVTCIGTITYINPESGLLDEFVRITRPGGIVAYTNRTDKLDKWKKSELELERQGNWLLEQKIGPIPYLPQNKEYGRDIEVVILIYRVLMKSGGHHIIPDD